MTVKPWLIIGLNFKCRKQFESFCFNPIRVNNDWNRINPAKEVRR